MSALCTFAAFIMGIPLTLVLTPLLYVGTMIVAEIINHFSPLPPDFWRQANDLAKLGMRVADYVINQKGTLDPGELTAGLLLVLLPGMVVAFGLVVCHAGAVSARRRGRHAGQHERPRTQSG